ncbi:MAG: 4Fe-4S dicluster domain-containing protein [Candidatus Acidiferrales bacterium]
MNERQRSDRGLVEVNTEECKGCGLCVEACPPRVLRLSSELNRHGVHFAEYAGAGCSGCGICFFVCPEPGGLTVYRAAAQQTNSQEESAAA